MKYISKIFISFLLIYNSESARDQELSDTEVILNPGPMLSPDIIIGQYVDSKVTVYDKIIEEVHNMMFNHSTTSPSIDKFPEEDDEVENDGVEIDDENNEVENDQVELDDNELNDGKDWDDDFSSSRESREDDSSEYKPCKIRINGTSGSFPLNFTDDCTILITSPNKSSRLILQCENLHLRNCSDSRDSLTINVKGDLKFRRNSYLYCGSNPTLRAIALSRKISIKIRKDEKVRGGSTCNFHTRKQRFFLSRLTAGRPDPKEEKELCGKLGRNSKIVGGRKVDPGLFPWAAQLDITRTDGSVTACTGSLISSNYVLSASHCLQRAESVSVFLGGTDRKAFTGSEINIQAEKFILHKRWNSKSLTADLALVKLTDHVKFTEEVSPICLPTRQMLRETWNGKKGVALGWGRVKSTEVAPRQLHRVKIPFMDDRSCQRVYRRFFQPTSMICVDSTSQAAICYGDSGGPLMYRRGEKVYQIGVASFSLSKKCGESPDVFTKVGEYSSWIRNRIQPEHSINAS